MKSESIHTAVSCLEPDLPVPMLQWGQEILCASSTHILAYTLHPKTPHIFPSCAEKPSRKQRSHCQQPVTGTVLQQSDLHLSK